MTRLATLTTLAASLLLAAPSAPAAEPSGDVVRTEQASFRVETYIDGLDHPWAIAFLPDGRRLVTERAGRLRIITPDGQLVRRAVEGTPTVWARGQGGLLDVEPHPDFASNGWIYLAFSRPEANGAMTALVRGRIRDGRWSDQQTIYTVPATEATTSPVHFGCRIRFDRDGFLFFTIGERGEQNKAQRLDLHNGKVFRLLDDGRIPPDNPFVNQPGAVAATWSWGHRNPQGLAFDASSGRLWSTEHGPRGGDELNVIRRGANYGWPVITFGINYNGTKITDLTAKEGMEQPQYQWTPSIGASGLEVVSGTRFPSWKGDILAGGLAYNLVDRFEVDGEKVLSRETILQGRGRVRDVREGPDGLIYIVIDDPGRILRLVPAD